MSVHDGHRERLRSRFLEYGLDHFDEVNALELLLFYAIPRKDTNPVAHALLEQFGSLRGVLEASEQELCAVPGISRNAAALLKLVPALQRKSKMAEADEIKYIHSAREAGAYLIPRFLNERDEVALVVCLDSQRRVIRCLELGRGVVNAVDFNIRRLVEAVLKSKASSVILAHNHPDGLALPSVEDDAVTLQVYRSLELVGVQLYDHIVVSGDDFVSFRDSGWFHMVHV